MELSETIVLSMGVAWASGINLYAVLLMLGLMGVTGHMILPADLQVLQDPIVLIAAGFMYCVEFFADKIPGVDNGWDAIHTFIRIPAGAVLAATAVGDVSMAAQVAAAIVGGTLTTATHATKAGSRVLVNTSPEPLSNWALSIAEDLTVVAGLWAALNYPWAFTAILVVLVVLMIWFLPKLWRGIQIVFSTIKGWLSGERMSVPGGESDSADKLNYSLASSASRTDSNDR